MITVKSSGTVIALCETAEEALAIVGIQEANGLPAEIEESFEPATVDWLAVGLNIARAANQRAEDAIDRLRRLA